jgi:hypothetical protein
MKSCAPSGGMTACQDWSLGAGTTDQPATWFSGSESIGVTSAPCSHEIAVEA